MLVIHLEKSNISTKYDVLMLIVNIIPIFNEHRKVEWSYFLFDLRQIILEQMDFHSCFDFSPMQYIHTPIASVLVARRLARCGLYEMHDTNFQQETPQEAIFSAILFLIAKLHLTSLYSDKIIMVDIRHFEKTISQG